MPTDPVHEGEASLVCTPALRICGRTCGHTKRTDPLDLTPAEAHGYRVIDTLDPATQARLSEIVTEVSENAADVAL